jgi:TRAP-type uncharacterized transport system fused permease subunit
MSGKITALVITLSAGSLILALPIVMLAAVLFGMGLPTVVCYVLLAATVAPSLVDLGVIPIAAHLYIFYFGMLRKCRPHENGLDRLDLCTGRFFAALYVCLQ